MNLPDPDETFFFFLYFFLYITRAKTCVLFVGWLVVVLAFVVVRRKRDRIKRTSIF